MLEAETHQEHARLAALHTAVMNALAQGDTLRELLQQSAAAIVHHLDAAFARIWTLNVAEQVLELQASAGMYSHLDGAHGRVPVGQLKIGLIAAERRPHLTNDVAGDPRVSDPAWARREGISAFAGYPLLVDDRLVGVMAMFARHALNDATLAALGSVASGIALGIERKQAEAARDRALATAELERTRLYRILMQTPALISFLRGPKHIVEIVNPRSLELIRRPELLGKPLREAMPELAGRGFYELMDRVYSSGETVVGKDVPFPVDRRGDGQLEDGYFNFVYQPTRDIDGQVDGILVHAVEVTDQVQARRQMEALAAEKDAFLASTSHDLKNPLAAIKGITQLLQRRLQREGSVTTERLAAGLDSIEKATDQLAEQIAEMLDITRLRMGEPLELTPGPVDLIALVRASVARYQASSDMHRLSLLTDLPALVGSWDDARLRRVLGNLLQNAIKYSPAGGEVLIRVERRHDTPAAEAVVSVIDQGVGIPAADLPKLFTLFQRASNVQGRIAGTGIGLAAVRQIVEQHGGTVLVESTEGRGSTFTLTLPLGQDGG